MFVNLYVPVSSYYYSERIIYGIFLNWSVLFLEIRARSFAYYRSTWMCCCSNMSIHHEPCYCALPNNVCLPCLPCHLSRYSCLATVIMPLCTPPCYHSHAIPSCHPSLHSSLPPPSCYTSLPPPSHYGSLPPLPASFPCHHPHTTTPCYPSPPPPSYHHPRTRIALAWWALPPKLLRAVHTTVPRCCCLRLGCCYIYLFE